MTKKIKVKSFNKWTQQEVEQVFHLTPHHHLDSLQYWLNLELPPELTIHEADKAYLSQRQLNAIDFIDSWTEQELIINYLAFILEAAKLGQTHYRAFANRPLKATVDNIAIAGMVDLMVASGRYEPIAPYFCFHEYKKAESRDKSDPRGQLLITMLAAQALNESQHPIYGAYISGRLWYFVVLDKQDYAISLPYDSTQDGLWDILRIMKGLNVLIKAIINQ